MFLLQSALSLSGILFPEICCRPAFGAETKLVPSCEIKEEFNDNVFLTASDRKSDFITILTPNLAFSHASERLNIDFLTGLGWHSYSRSEGIGSMDYQYNAQIAHKLTPQDDIGVSASYVRNTRPDSISQTTGLTASPGMDHYQYSANIRRLIDESTSASMMYSFLQDTYDNPASQSNRVHNAGLIFSKDLGSILPLLKGTLSSNYSRAIYRDSTTDNYSLRVGVSRNINEKLNFNMSAGGQLMHSTFITTTEVSNDSWGAVGSTSLSYTGEKAFGSLSLARDFTAASGQVGPVETTSFGLTLGRGLSDRMTVQIAANYNINQSSSGQFSSRGTDDRALNLKADFVYKISKFFDVGLQYSYYTVTYGLSDLLIAQNSVIVRAAAKYPITW